jgi:hypothetical protein
MNATAEQVTQQAEQLTAQMDDLKKQVRGGCCGGWWLRAVGM